MSLEAPIVYLGNPHGPTGLSASIAIWDRSAAWLRLGEPPTRSQTRRLRRRMRNSRRNQRDALPDTGPNGRRNITGPSVPPPTMRSSPRRSEKPTRSARKYSRAATLRLLGANQELLETRDRNIC